MRGLHYPRLICERLSFPLALTQTLQVLVRSCLPQQIFNFSSKLLTRFEKTAKEFASYAQIHKTYSQNCKYIHYSSIWRNKLTKWAISFVTQRKWELQGQRTPFDVIHFFIAFNIPFEANASIKPTKYLFNTLSNIFHVSTFQQLFSNTAIFRTVFISRLMT